MKSRISTFLLGFSVATGLIWVWKPDLFQSARVEVEMNLDPVIVQAVKVPEPAPVVPSVSTIPNPVVHEKSILDRVKDVLDEHYVDPALLKKRDFRVDAIKGVLDGFEGSVTWIPSGTKVEPLDDEDILNNVTPLGKSMGYLRLSRIAARSALLLSREIKKLVSEQGVRDLIVDLRYAGGDDYPALGGLVSLFAEKDEGLFRIQNKSGTESREVRSQLPSEKLDLNLILLVNKETRGAAEVFVSVMQEKKLAVVVGNAETAGKIFASTDIPIDGGDVLRVATSRIVTARGKDLFMKSVHPDVRTGLAASLESKIMSQAFKIPDVQSIPRYYSEAILTGKEKAPPLSVKNNPPSKEVPLTNQDTTLLTAMDIFKSMQALGIAPKASKSTDATSKL